MPAPSPSPPYSTNPLPGLVGLDGDDNAGEVTWATGRDSSVSRSGKRSRIHPTLTNIQRPVASLSGAASIPPSAIIDAAGADPTLPLLSPTAPSAAAAASPDRPYLPHQPKSLAGIALRSFCLGIALAVGLASTLSILLFTNSTLWRLPFFLAALSTFHFLEFWTTAAYNTPAANVGSFLLTANWPAYAIAHAAASLECLVTNALFPRRDWAPLGTGPLLLLVGLACVAGGQVVRSAAMVQAGPSFNHIVQRERGRGHVLVTTGIYATLRHPSYFGFFWWALGTQLVLGNVVCFCAYAAALWRFFSTRVRVEEELLVGFFGDEYVDYKNKVGTKIPFVP